MISGNNTVIKLTKYTIIFAIINNYAEFTKIIYVVKIIFKYSIIYFLSISLFLLEYKLLY